MKRELIINLTTSELLDAVGDWMIEKGLFKEGDYSKIKGFGLEKGKPYKFEVFNDGVEDVMPRSQPKEKHKEDASEHVHRMLRIEKDEAKL